MNADNSFIASFEEFAKVLIEKLQLEGILMSKEEIEDYKRLKILQQKMFTGRAFAKAIGMSCPGVTSLRQRGLIKGVRIGKRWMYPASEIEKIRKEKTIN